MHLTAQGDHGWRRRANPLRRWLLIGSLGAIVVLAAACSSSASSPTSTALKQRTASARTTAAVVSAKSVGSLGTILVDQSGLTLYRFSPDGTGKRTCTGACAMTWPPLTVSSPQVTAGNGVTASALGTITRPDGSLQVAFNGMPLYRFSGDKKAGDTAGQGVGGTWFVVPATAAAAPTPSTSPTTAPPASSSTTSPTSPATTPHVVMPAPAATAPPATAPPATSPPVTSPPATSPPPTSPPTSSPGGGGYGY